MAKKKQVQDDQRKEYTDEEARKVNGYEGKDNVAEEKRERLGKKYPEQFEDEK